jgi:ABC-type phosphate transport system substrate-binding protein
MTLMSRTLAAPRWGLSAALAGLVALALTALAALCLTPQASADFTTGKCAGSDTSGRGASFARDAHTWFNANFKVNYCAGTPGFGSIDVAYDPAGSGGGRTSMKVRTDIPRFGMSDEPPTPEEIEQMNRGGSGTPFVIDGDPTNDGQIHVIPAAAGAVAPLVNWPNGCEAADLPDAAKTSTDAKLIRVRFTKAQFEEIWAQGETGATPTDYLTWRDVFPTLDDIDACKKPIIRVVRFDDSGTSFAFKDYLNSIDPAEGWLSTYNPSGDKTRVWPGAELGSGGQCGGTVAPGKAPDETDHLTSGCNNGNAFLVQTLKATDGSVGYSDISTARGEGLAVNPSGGDVDQFWTQIQNGSGEFTEPTANPNGFRTDGAKGANCAKTEFKNVPATTLGNWAPVSGVNSDEGFGICTLTYGLVFEDNAAVWGDNPAEESKARTVKDYWQSIVSETAQKGLSPADYAPLPSDILAISKAGVEQIGWKGGSGGPEDETPPPPPPPPGGGETPPPPPSNQFSLLKKTISSKTGGATISVKVPGAGKLEIVGTAKVGGKMIKVGRTVLNAGKAGTFKLALSPSAAAKAQLRKRGSLKMTLKLTFTPTGGTASSSSSGLVLKLAKKGK